MPKISIVVPIYNVEKYIGDCLESLINQTFTDIQIICVDDRGNDASMQIVKNYARRDPRIKIIRNWRNRGLSYSRNHAMRHVKTPYVMYCDSDDMFMPDMCEKMYSAIESNQSDVAVSGVRVLYDTDLHLKESDDAYFVVHGTGTFLISRVNNNIHFPTAWGKIFRTEIIRKHKIKFPTGKKYEDEYFWNVYMLWSKSITFVQDKLYVYRRRVGSIMNIAWKEQTLDFDPIDVAIAYHKYCKKYGIFDEKRDWYWGNWFPHMAGTAIRFSGEHNIEACLKHTVRFIKKNYTPSGLSPESIGMMENIRSYFAERGYEIP